MSVEMEQQALGIVMSEGYKHMTGKVPSFVLTEKDFGVVQRKIEEKLLGMGIEREAVMRSSVLMEEICYRGAVVCLASVAVSLGIPLEAIGMVLSVDPLVSMLRTPLNSAGGIAVTLLMARRAGVLDEKTYQAE